LNSESLSDSDWCCSNEFNFNSMVLLKNIVFESALEGHSEVYCIEHNMDGNLFGPIKDSKKSLKTSVLLFNYSYKRQFLMRLQACLFHIYGTLHCALHQVHHDGAPELVSTWRFSCTRHKTNVFTIALCINASYTYRTDYKIIIRPIYH
jgi:hypothetical protein